MKIYCSLNPILTNTTVLKNVTGPSWFPNSQVEYKFISNGIKYKIYVALFSIQLVQGSVLENHARNALEMEVDIMKRKMKCKDRTLLNIHKEIIQISDT